ncbi:head closure Hc1 [Idiomarinaceae phage 1N2-2]|uniref:head closure Hc1 n=1 Tax=Idiomarinaceae phage 1N2-2 TaxID=1536592 RepID=UPI0004F5F0AD|nr:head closure Hc1 [Idiomarinaceae phage 1N2-2]AIM40718.1 putative head-tail adaptor protein [Idiomarinaceae phage 1N2-2]
MKCCDVKLGDLNRKIEIRSRQVTGSDPMGGDIIEWVTHAEPWAKMKPMTGREQYRADKLNAEGMTQVIIRYRDDLDETMKVVYRDVEYQIRSIINVEERDEWTELMIERGVSQ